MSEINKLIIAIVFWLMVMMLVITILGKKAESRITSLEYRVSELETNRLVIAVQPVYIQFEVGTNNSIITNFIIQGFEK